MLIPIRFLLLQSEHVDYVRFAVKVYPLTTTTLALAPGVSSGVNAYPLTATAMALDTGPETILTVPNSAKTVVTLGTRL